jgi:signal transduction histidine kinase
MTVRLLAGVAGLTVLLTYLLIESRPPHRGPRERMEQALQSMQLREAELNRDVLMARAGLLPNYDSLGTTVKGLFRDVEMLQRESSVLPRERSAVIRREVAALAAGIEHKVRSAEYLKSDNALLRNSVAYFNESMRSVGAGLDNGARVIAVARLSHAMLHFVQSREPGARAEALAALSRVSDLSKQAGELEPLAVHGRVILNTLPNIDRLLAGIVAPATGDHEKALQTAILAYGAEGEQRAQSFRLLLYFVALSLLAYVIYSFARLRARSRELRQKEMQLIQANKMTSLGTLVSGVVHEINNPNQIIMMNSGVLASAWNDAAGILDDLGDGKEFSIAGLPHREMRETIPQLIQQIEVGSRRIESIVQDLKGFSRPGRTIQELFELNDAVQRALRLLTPLIQKRTDHFHVRLAENLPVLCGNPQQVEQILVNLVINALEALPGREHSVAVTTSLDAALHTIRMEVEDTGNGIAKEHLSHLGEPFFTTKSASGGTGLGLAITSTLVRMHRGKLTFSSEPGKGTRATVELPCRHDANNPPQQGLADPHEHPLCTSSVARR